MSDRGWWSGKVRPGWSTARLKDVVELTNGWAFDSDRFGQVEGVPLIRIRDLLAGRTQTFYDGPVPDDVRVENGDLLVGMDGDFNSTVWRGGAAALNQRLCRLRAKPPLTQAYLAYLIDLPLKYINFLTYSTTVKHLSSLHLLDERIPLPDPDLQRSISAFLDVETGRIDALRERKRQMLSLLEERVSSRVLDLIAESSIAGGQKDVVPIRRVLMRIERWADGGEMVTAFRDGEVTTRVARNRDGFTNAWTDGARVQRVEVGDVVIHGLDGFSGAIGDAQRSGVCSPVYHVCEAGQGDGAFYGRLLRLLALGGYLGNFATSTRERAVDFRNWDLFGRIPVPLVPVDEQRAIGDEIRKIRPLRDRIRASEALALEHRQALITAAVTGELEVPGVAA